MLELKDVACVRGARTLFTGVTCQLRPGELLRVRGANGAGKTSLLRMLCGLLEPTQGQILWRGHNIAALREEFGAELIYLGHAAALKDDLTPLENLQVACTLAAQPMGLPEARRALDDAGLRGHQNTQVRRLSQGKKSPKFFSKSLFIDLSSFSFVIKNEFIKLSDKKLSTCSKADKKFIISLVFWMFENFT